jgi:dihydropteroate synthase
MGIVNVTPDSFSDGGRFLEKERAVERALQLAEDGADMVDIGGESTRPGAEPVETAVELARVIPVVEAAARTLRIPISVDTTKAEVAERALDAGAAMVNDISALRFDARMPDVVAARGASVVLMHMQGVPLTMQVSPQYDRALEDILGFLHEQIAFAAGRGIPKSRIIVDPGIGFGKTLEHNLEILRNADRFHETGCPVMVGASRKKLIELLSGAAVGERDWGTAALTAWCVIMGVDIQRVHDVKAMRQVCDVTAALNEGSTRVRSDGV